MIQKLVKKGIIIMIGLSSFLDYAKGQNRPLEPIEGIMIYNDSVGLPQEVLFIPKKLKKGGQLKPFIRKALSDPETYAYVVYFQGVRWILPDLESTVVNLKSDRLAWGTSGTPAKITYGRLTFDTSYRPDPSVASDRTIHHVPLVFHNRSYKLKVTELPDTMGIMVLFEEVVFDF